MYYWKAKYLSTPWPVPHKIGDIPVACTKDNKPDQTYVGLTSNTFKT